jgi:hypothetical protein
MTEITHVVQHKYFVMSSVLAHELWQLPTTHFEEMEV